MKKRNEKNKNQKKKKKRKKIALFHVDIVSFQIRLMSFFVFEKNPCRLEIMKKILNVCINKW